MARNLARHPGRVLGFFCFDPIFLARPDFSPDRFGFFLETLLALQAELREAGGELLVLDRGPDRAFAETLEKLRNGPLGPPALVTFNRDYEPFALDRDARLQAWLEGKQGIPTETARDHLIIEPMEITKDSQEAPFYQVFTPFRKKWLTLARDESAIRERWLTEPATRAPRLQLRWKEVLKRGAELPDCLGDALDQNRKNVRVPLPPAGTAAAHAALKRFAGARLAAYASARDIPSLPGTSQLSIYFKNGSLTTADVIRRLELDRVALPPVKRAKGKPAARTDRSGEFTFLSELIWREFYYHVLAHFPFVERDEFNPRLRGLRWRNDPAEFAAWREGRTGFPIVDAGMRQLNATGWMHNRVRMIVASFLVKDLLVDWRWGERYFMERLLDGDLAPNNGGWQWAASTGVDPNPYFRIFNPDLQTAKFDPDGNYARRWIPELGTSSYPRPIVDHAERKAATLTEYRRLARASRSPN